MITEPLLSNPKGGITALLFIIANEALERLASFGLSTNMIMYLTREYGMDAASGAQILFVYSSAGNFMPIIGAFLADTYVGHYPMIGFGCITSLLGMVLLWLTAIIPEARVPSCAQFSSTCNNEATTPQLLFLYFCLALMSIGAGGIRSCSLAFGADQLRKRDSLKYAGILESFFSWYYVISSASVFISMTCLVYIQDALGWKVGFGVPVVLMILLTLSFFLASPIYVKPRAKANWLVGFARVLVASFRKRRIELCSQNPSQIDFVAAKKVLRYLKGTLDFGMNFVKTNITNLVGFSDSDWARSDEEMTSTSGICFSLGGTIFRWNSKKQTVVAHSTAEAEYIAAYVAENQLVWLRKILGELSFEQTDPTGLMCENMAAIAISKNYVFHNRTKHMKIKFHAIRQFQSEGELEMKYCPAKKQLADLFTKSLTKDRFEDLRVKVGMCSYAVLEPRGSVED